MIAGNREGRRMEANGSNYHFGHYQKTRPVSNRTNSRNNAPFFLVTLYLTLVISYAEIQSPALEQEKGIREGQLVNNSTSPNGKYALYEFHHWEGNTPDSATTATAIGLAPTDRSRLLIGIDSFTKWSTDKEVTSFLTICWNTNSQLLATHDSSAKNSKLRIYRIAGGSAQSLEIPDLLQIACSKLGLKREAVRASGQIPIDWTGSVLRVEVTASTEGKKFTSQFSLHVTEDGKVSVE